MGSADPDIRLMSIVDDESVPIEGGTLQWVPVRRRLGIRAFGANAFRAARKGDPVVEDHVESPGQEELYVVVAGRVSFVVGEQELEASAGTAIFVARPELRRRGVALQDDTVVLAVGGWPDRAYHSLPWEPIYLAQEPMRRGDWAGALDTLDREAGEHRDTAVVRFRLACCHARLGEPQAALEELRRAIEINPSFRERAANEEHLVSLREHEGWPAAVS